MTRAEKIKVTLLISLALFILTVVVLTILFFENYVVTITKREPIIPECLIQGVATGIVCIGEENYQVGENVCGGQIINISSKDVTVSFDNIEETYLIGEVIKKYKVEQISLGMSKKEIGNIIGEPDLVKEIKSDGDNFKDAWVYVENLKEGKRTYSLYFVNDKLIKMTGR